MLAFWVLVHQLAGTEPGELGLPPQPSSACNCHIGYDENAYIEPWDTYASTPMALAAIDPLFRAALQVAHQDRPELSPTCIRCHAPLAWLSERGTPGDGSLMSESLGDFEGITCDVCHRAVPTDPPLVGDAQYTIAQEATKRAARGNGPGNGHSVAASEYIGSSNLCALCHSLFNPFEQHHSPAQESWGFPYYEQRTFEEWTASVFPSRGKGCVECHLQKVTGSAASQTTRTYSDLSGHTIVGGNTWLVRAVQAVSPNHPVGDVGAFLELARQSLRDAASLEFVGPLAVEGPAGGSARVKVRFTNLTGHKLPTGYPEGRKIVLEVSRTIHGVKAVISGAFDPAAGVFVPDEQLRVYDTGHGCSGNGSKCSEPGRNRHLAIVDSTLWDTRIPPEGYRPSAPDMVPIGRDYGQSPPYRHYDEVEFEVPIPAGTAAGTTGSIQVRALFQATDGAYVRFLVETLGPNHPDAARLQLAYDRTGRAAPVEMTTAETSFRVVDAPDAGLPDASHADASEDGHQVKSVEGCSCDTASGSVRHAGWGWILVGLGLRRRRVRS